MPSLNTPQFASKDPSRAPFPESGHALPGAAHGRYGRVGLVPWSYIQTIQGLAFTLVPWFVFIVASQFSAKSNSALPTLSRGQDIEQGVSVFILTALLEAVFLIAPVYFALKSRAPGASRLDGLRALGFRKAPFWNSALQVVVSMVMVLAVSYIYGILVDHFKLGLQTNVQTLLNEIRAEPITVICTLIGAVIIAPICEETFFRGFAFAGLLRGTNFLMAALVSAALFTAAHGDIGSAAPLFILGLLLANLRWRSGSIWPGIALHMFNNLVAAIFVIYTLTGH